MRRFRVGEVPAPGRRVALDGAGAHHLLHVLHIERGETVEVFDGTGTAATARLAEVVDGVPWLEGLSEPRAARPAHDVHLLLAVAKGPAMDDAVRMATEAGATHIHPLLTARSVAKGERGDRWERIALSAAQQCGRACVPVLAPLTALPTALAALPASLDARIALPGAPSLPPATGPAAVLIGPEGGFTDEEIATALRAGLRPMGLGPWVLRVETAAPVAVSRLVF